MLAFPLQKGILRKHPLCTAACAALVRLRGVPWDVPWRPMGRSMGRPVRRPMGRPMARPMGLPMARPMGLRDVPWELRSYVAT